MLGVTAFGLIFTPLFYAVTRGVSGRASGPAPLVTEIGGQLL